MSYLVLACRVTLVAVFGCSVLAKLRGRAAYAQFVASVPALGPVPARWVAAVAAGTVLSEAAVVVLLATPAAGPAGFLAGAGLLAAFTVAIAVAVRRGRREPCRCFGASTTPLGLPHLLRNGALLAVCLTGAAGGWWVTTPATHPAGVAVALVAAAVAVLFVLRLDDVVALLEFG